MAWQVDHVAAVNAITNIGKRMRHIEPPQASNQWDPYSITGHYETQIRPQAVKTGELVGAVGQDDPSRDRRKHPMREDLPDARARTLLEILI